MKADFDVGDCLAPEVPARVPDYADQFRTARPFPHVVIDGFLAETFCARIIEAFPDFDERTAVNEGGEIGGKSTRERVRQLGPAFARLDDLIRSPAFLDLIEGITGIESLQYDPWYFGGGTHENRHGQDLDPHIDFNYHPISRQHRRLNMIIYLNEEWEDDWGGLLQLHEDPYRPPGEDDITSIAPRRNRCVIFETSERSWHGFEPIELPEDKRHLSRKSFAVYYYTRRRPPGETAAEHSTVYVERHLPAQFVPGLTLDDQDVEEIRRLLARRDQHLRRLYGEIQSLQSRLGGSRLRRLARTLRYWLLRAKA